MRLTWGLWISVALVFMAGFGSAASAQTTASLRGVVTDQSGAVIVGAKVTLTNTGTNISRTTAVDARGDYLFSLVDPGTYSVKVEKPGFLTYEQNGIVLEVNQNGRLDVTLKIGETTQTVEVTANVPQVDTTGAVLGDVETTRRILDLPLLDRNTLALGLLQAGVFAPDPDDGSGNPFSVSGQRSESMTFLLNGADNTDFLNNRIVVNPNPDAIQEFKILTNNYDAQFGRTSGGIVNTVVKSGKNGFHGDLFEFFRNDVLNANDFFLNESGITRPSFKRNVFGGTLGGPIIKNKTFFFASYQGTRRREGQVSPFLTVPDQAERGGDFSELCPMPNGTGTDFDSMGNCLNTTTGTQLVNPVTGANYPFNKVPVDPVSAQLLNKYVPLPLPALSGNTFISAPTANIREDQGILRVDHALSPRDSLSFVYLVDDLGDLFPFLINKGASTGGDVPVGSGFSDATRRQIGVITWSHSFAGGWTNEFHFSANRRATLQADPVDKTLPSAFGFALNPDDPAGAAPPVITTPDFNLGPSPQGPTTLHDATFQWQDNLDIPRGRHDWRFGASISRVRNNFNFDFFNNGGFDFGSFGTFTGNPLADFVGGFPDNFFQFTRAIYGIRETSTYFYGQDTWKILPRLTLDLGLRYEYNSPQTDPHKEILGFFPGRQSVVFPQAPPDILYPGDPNTCGPGLVCADRNNFAPRFGFAWDIFGNAKLVMRGGFGIFYDIEDGALNLQFGGQPPFGVVPNFFPTSVNFQTAASAGTTYFDSPYVGQGVSDPFPFFGTNKVGTFPLSPPQPKISFAFVTVPNFRTPYSEHFNYGFQYQMTPNTMVQAVYVGSLGRKLISSAETNFPVPSVEMQQLATFASVNIDCARPLAACIEPNGQPVTGPNADPNATPTGSTVLLTDLSNGLSESHEFQLTLDKRFSRGFQFRAAYTVSKTIDLTSGFRARSSEFTDPLDYRLDRALADFDTPQRLVISGIWQLPIDRPFQSGGFMKKLTEGWQIAEIVTFQKGNPLNFFSNGNASQQNNFLDRPDIIGRVTTHDPRNSQQTYTSDCLGGATVSGNFYIDPTNLVCSPCPFSDPACSRGETGVPLFTFGTLGRNAIRGPGINQWDMSLFKTFPISEDKKVEFRAEAFNIFNHTQFEDVDHGGFSGTFGQAIDTRGPRLMQLALKFYF